MSRIGKSPIPVPGGVDVTITGRTVTVKVKFHDFQIITRSRTLSGLVDSEGALRDVSLGLIRSIYPVPKGIRLVGVTVSKFEARPIHEEAELPLAPA